MAILAKLEDLAAAGGGDRDDPGQAPVQAPALPVSLYGGSAAAGARPLLIDEGVATAASIIDEAAS